jgi:predicted nucleic acid-binding protein
MEPRSQRFPRRKNQTNRTNEDTSGSRIEGREEKNKNGLNSAYQGGPRTPSLILDSNILVKLVMNEPRSKEARTTVANVLKKGYTLYTVDLALAEGLNAIWKHAGVLKDLKVEEANPAAEDLTRIYDGLNIIAAREVTTEAMHVALTQNITVYDALYIAAAQKTNSTLYTADRKLHEAANGITNTKLLKQTE